MDKDSVSLGIKFSLPHLKNKTRVIHFTFRCVCILVLCYNLECPPLGCWWKSTSCDQSHSNPIRQWYIHITNAAILADWIHKDMECTLMWPHVLRPYMWALVWRPDSQDLWNKHEPDMYKVGDCSKFQSNKRTTMLTLSSLSVRTMKLCRYLSDGTFSQIYCFTE